MTTRKVWFLVTVVVIAIIVAIDYFTGTNAIANLIRIALGALAYLWRVFISVSIAAAEFIWQLLVRGIGWRRITRPLSAMAMGIGVGYLLTGTTWYTKAVGWRVQLRGFIDAIRVWWNRQHFITKVLIVIGMIGLQVWLHFWVVLFPVGFLISFLVKRVQHWGADEMFGAWYWRFFGPTHHRIVSFLKNIPGVGCAIRILRVVRLWFRGGWRLWKYEFAKHGQIRGRVLLLQNLHRWKKYFGRPLFAGARAQV